LTLPAAWKWLGTRPTSNIIAIPDGYLAMIDLLSVGTTIFASGGIADSAAAYLPLLLGLTTGNMYSGSVLPDFQHFGTGLSSSSQAQLQGSADAIGPRVILSKTRGTTAASKTVVQASDSLGMVQWEGADGTNFVAAAYVKGIVDGTPGTNDMPGAVLIGTTADGASAVTDRVKITNAGDVQLLTNDRYIYLRGSESVNDSIRMSYQSGTDVILFESRDSGSWVPKHTWSMA
jgi:hypothetical protein